MKRHTIHVVFYILIVICSSCKPDCQQEPDSMFFSLFKIVDNNDNSLLKGVYPIDDVIVYNIEDSTKPVNSWKRITQDPGIGIVYFDDKIDKLGENHRKYGFKLNQYDTDTLEMYFTVKPKKTCVYECDSIVMFYNRKKYLLNGYTVFSFIKY